MSKLLKGDELEEEEIKKLKRRIAGLSEQSERIFIQSIWGLVRALEAKDPYSKSHSENVVHYSVNIAQTMKITPRKIKIIRRAAMIHDIGKIGIPDAILTKPGKLTRHEYKIIEQHPLIAVQILSKMEFLELEMSIVRHHHEKWNGQGYPDSLSGTAIPLGARIMAVADTFDALTSSRSYHNPRSLVDAMNILVDSSGYEFDPKVVKGMINWIEKTAYLIGKNVDKLIVDDLLNSENVSKHDSLIPVIDSPATYSVRT
jgi:HD-GYP domain-containing protein (c-di-GMP phosphodiesterase class II)